MLQQDSSNCVSGLMLLHCHPQLESQRCSCRLEQKKKPAWLIRHPAQHLS